MDGKRRRRGRDGGVLLEAVLAIALFAFLVVPVIQSFQLGVRQTKVVKDRLIGRAVASWALASSRSDAQAGILVVGSDSLTADALMAFPGVGPQLPSLQVSRDISEVEPGLFLIQVVVTWVAANRPTATQIELSALERAEV